MRVATWRGEANFTIDEVPDPVADEGQVVVKVDTVGVCGSDVHLTQGLFPGEPPRVLGHEFSGVVVETGTGIDSSVQGRGVVVIPTWVCGDCAGCRVGMRNICEAPLRAFGLAEYAVMPEYNALEVPPGLDLQTAAIMEPSACCLSGLEMFEMPEDAVVLVIGAGVMGLMTAAFAKLRGAKTVVVSEPIESRRNIAAGVGADQVIDPTSDDLEGLIMDLTDGLGAHVVCEAVGTPALVGQAIQLTRPRGNLQLVGVNPAGSTLPSDLFDLHFREITIRGAFGGGESYQRALNLLPQVPSVEQVVTSSYPLEQVHEAFAEASNPEGIKVAVKPNG